jgi:hypothetical protein
MRDTSGLQGVQCIARAWTAHIARTKGVLHVPRHGRHGAQRAFHHTPPSTPPPAPSRTPPPARRSAPPSPPLRHRARSTTTTNRPRSMEEVVRCRPRPIAKGQASPTDAHGRPSARPISACGACSRVPSASSIASSHQAPFVTPFVAHAVRATRPLDGPPERASAAGVAPTAHSRPTGQRRARR